MHTGLVQSAKAPLQTAVVTLKELSGQRLDMVGIRIKGASCVVENKSLLRPKPLAHNKPYRSPDCKSAQITRLDAIQYHEVCAASLCEAKQHETAQSQQEAPCCQLYNMMN